MRRRDHEVVVAALKEQIERLEAQNADLLNRCMSQDWTQYAAISNQQVFPEPELDHYFDQTGLIEVIADHGE